MHSGLVRAVTHRSVWHRRLFTRLPLMLAPLLILVLAACGQDAAPPTPTILASPLAPTAETPDALTSPLPTPVGKPPDPEPGMGHVQGKFATLADKEAIASATLFLGDLLGEDGDITGVGLDPDRAPQTETDAEGRFVFLNVVPGEYSLIWWRSHRESYPLSSAGQDEGELLIVTVEEANLTDLGDVVTANSP